MTSPLPDLLTPGVQVVIAGTIRAGRVVDSPHYYAAAGNRFWWLLHVSGLVPCLLSPDEDVRVLDFGVGLTDLVSVVHERAGHEPEVRWLVTPFAAKIAATAPDVVAFVSKTAAARYARGAGERAPRVYGELSWTVAGVPAFVLPGPSGANNGMPLPLRAALWRDLADFLDTLCGRPRWRAATTPTAATPTAATPTAATPAAGASSRVPRNAPGDHGALSRS